MTKTVIQSLLARVREISLDKQECPNNKTNTVAVVSPMRKQQGRLLTRKQYERKGNAELSLTNFNTGRPR